MSERIKSIYPVADILPPGQYGKFAGYEVLTNRQRIRLLISDEASCCESWGYFLSEDDTKSFEGAEFMGVRVVDVNLTSKTFDNDWRKAGPDNISLDDGDTMFVNIQTDRGVLQFVAYNAHNGYYGHAALITQEAIVHEDSL
jgi:hypothetical protein